MSHLLTCTSLRRDFGGLRAVDDVSVTVESGARHALIGPNGAGKSTLFRLITGVLSPTSGRVHLEDTDMTRMAEHRRVRLGMSQTFQHSSLFDSMTALRNVVLALRRSEGNPASFLPRRRRSLDARAGELLEEVGLGPRGDEPIAALSHGERRQLEIALALASRPRLLLLDEPFAGMATAESERLATLIERLSGEVTVLFVEHDLDLVFRLATQVTVLHLGAVLDSGSPEQVRANAAVQEAYLGTESREDLFIPPDNPGIVAAPSDPVEENDAARRA